MGGLATVLGVVNQVAGFAAPFFEREASYRASEKRAEADAVRTQMQIDAQLQKAEDQEWNARQAELEAEAAKNAGKINEAEAAENAYRAKARQRAILAQNGSYHGATGTAVMEQADSRAADDQFKIQYNTGREVQGFLSRADDYRRQAGYYRQTAGQTAKAAQLRREAASSSSKSGNILNGLDAVGSILGGVSSVYNLFRQG